MNLEKKIAFSCFSFTVNFIGGGGSESYNLKEIVFINNESKLFVKI